MRPFLPRFRNPHLATIAGNYWPRRLDTERFPVAERLYQTADHVQVLVCEQRPEGRPKGEIILLHGLEGSSEAGYMRSMAQAALEAGYAVHRMNLRSCGGTAHLSDTLYHAGLTADLLSILEALHAQGRAPCWIEGYSLGGNVVLKLAGELGESAGRLIRGVCAVSTPIDLAACVDAMERRENRLYEWRFVRNMKRRMHVNGGFRTVREIDDRITAPAFGFGDAAGYYRTQSAIRFVDQIRIPALLVCAKDDPLVPFAIYGHPAITGNPNIRTVAVERGGHLGFIAKDKPALWLDGVVLEWMDGGGGGS